MCKNKNKRTEERRKRAEVCAPDWGTFPPRRMTMANAIWHRMKESEQEWFSTNELVAWYAANSKWGTTPNILANMLCRNVKAFEKHPEYLPGRLPNHMGGNYKIELWRAV